MKLKSKGLLDWGGKQKRNKRKMKYLWEGHGGVYALVNSNVEKGREKATREEKEGKEQNR